MRLNPTQAASQQLQQLSATTHVVSATTPLANSACMVSQTQLSHTVSVVCHVESMVTERSSKGVTHTFGVNLPAGNAITLNWVPQSSKERLPAMGALLYIEYTPPRTQHKEGSVPLASLIRWHPIDPVYNLVYLQQLFNKAVHPAMLIRLLKIIQRLSDLRLRNLLLDLFANPEIAIPFITLPASHNHHHNQAGGLLQHSLECAEWIAAMAYKTLKPTEAELVIAVALLHDLGKVETMSASKVSQMVSHEVMTLSMLEPFLTELQAKWKQGAHALREMLSWSPNNAKFPRLPGVLLVKMADQYSTSLSARKMAFAGQPDYHYWASLKTPTSIQFFNRIS